MNIDQVLGEQVHIIQIYVQFIEKFCWIKIKCFLFQCLLFSTPDTLEGIKKFVYIMIKIIKLITPPKKKITSYDIKFALDQYFCSKKHHRSTVDQLFNDQEHRKSLSVCIKDVFNNARVRELGSSPVHSDLKAIGVKEIVLEENGIWFVGQGDPLTSTTFSHSCYVKSLKFRLLYKALKEKLKTVMLFAILPYHDECDLSCDE